MPSTGWDKSNHAVAFAFLAVVGLSCWRFWPVLLGLAAYGAGIEVAQSFTETRVGDARDWLADVAGLAIVALWSARRGATDRKGGEEG